MSDDADEPALGERLDPEAYRQVLRRYAETARQAIEQHGGTVEKFIGDAVMSVFGVPVLHEDDALRAVRAAVALRRRVIALNEELEHEYATRLTLRIGINSGEIVTGAEDRLATGDAVNVAAHIASLASAGEILVTDAVVEAAGLGSEAIERRRVSLKGHEVGAAVVPVPASPA